MRVHSLGASGFGGVGARGLVEVLKELGVPISFHRNVFLVLEADVECGPGLGWVGAGLGLGWAISIPFVLGLRFQFRGLGLSS